MVIWWDGRSKLNFEERNFDSISRLAQTKGGELRVGEGTTMIDTIFQRKNKVLLKKKGKSCELDSVMRHTE